LIIDLLNAFPIEQFQWRAYASSEVNPAACDCVCDNDRLISWDTATSNAPEGLTHDVMIKLTSPDPLPSDVTVNIVAANGTASSADYTLLSTFIVIPAGSVDGDTFPVSVAITASDGIDNGETFTLTIDSVVGAAVIDEDHDVHTVTITDCATTGSYTINCATNNTMLQSGWTGCGGSPSVTTYNGTQSVVVTLPTSKRIKKIQVNWRSAFSPFLQIGDGKIIVAGTTYTQDVTGTGGTTSAQSVDNLYVTTNTFTIQTTGTINGSAPAGYVAFFSIVVTYCEDGG
jgi:hypothetical protein